MIHARDDEITTLDSVRRVFDALPVRAKELVVLEDSYHMITIDNERQRVAALLAGFARRISAGMSLPTPLPAVCANGMMFDSSMPDSIQRVTATSHS